MNPNRDVSDWHQPETDAMRPGRRFSLLAVALIILVSSLLLCFEIGEPFWGYMDVNSVLHSTGARNFLKYGLLATHFWPTVDTGLVDNGRFTFRVHHPPLVVYAEALFFWVLGESEFSGRLFFAFCAVASAVVIFFLGSIYLSRWEALACALAFALTPCVGYFGRMINYESPGLLFALVAFLAYARFLKSRSRRFLWLLHLANLLGLLTCWQDYFVAPAILLHYLLCGRREREPARGVLLLVGVNLLVFGIVLGYAAWLAGGITAPAYGGSLAGIFKIRIGRLIAPGRSFSFGDFLVAEGSAIVRLFTPVLAYGAVAWLIMLVVGVIRARRGRDDFDWLILSLFVYAGSYMLIFQQPTYLHDYLVYYMAPAMVFASVRAFSDLFELCLTRRRWVRMAATVILAWAFLSAGLDEFFRLHRNPSHDDWIDLGHFLAEQLAPDEAVILSWHTGDDYTEYYSDREIIRDVTEVAAFRAALSQARNRVVAYIDLVPAQASRPLIELLCAQTVDMPVHVGRRDYTAYIIRLPRRYRRAVVSRGRD